MMENEIGCVSPIYIVFKCGVEYKIYLQQLLTFEFMIKEINKRCSGSVRQALPFKDLCSIEIYDIEKDKLKLYNKYWDNILKNVASCNRKYVQKQLDKLDENYLDYIGYWNDKYYRAGFGDCLNLVIMSLGGGKFETR